MKLIEKKKKKKKQKKTKKKKKKTMGNKEFYIGGTYSVYFPLERWQHKITMNCDI